MTTSLLDIRDDATDLTTGVAAAILAVQAALASGTQTERQLGNLRASLTGYRADLAEIRTMLDATDVLDFQLYDDGAVTIQLWAWERALRHALIALAPAVRSAEAVAEQLVEGSTRDVYTTRSGDTLQTVAAKFLGDWKEWPRIAAANGLAGGAVPSGTRLTIPPRR